MSIPNTTWHATADTLKDRTHRAKCALLSHSLDGLPVCAASPSRRQLRAGCREDLAVQFEDCQSNSAIQPVAGQLARLLSRPVFVQSTDFTIEIVFDANREFACNPFEFRQAHVMCLGTRPMPLISSEFHETSVRFAVTS